MSARVARAGPALRRWMRQVQAHHAQSRRAMGEEPADFWRPFTPFFRQDPHRADDPALSAILRRLRPDDTVLDVGGGAGRFALPMALRCRQVTVVEPSPSMVEALREGMREAGIHNVEVVQTTWEEAQVAPHDVVLCSHVLYGVERVDGFLRKLVEHARRSLLVLMFMDAPISVFSRAWRLVRGERRVELPGLRLLLPVLWEMGLYPDLEMVQQAPPRPFPDEGAALEELRRRLYISPGSSEDQRLQRLLPRLLERDAGGLRLRGAPPRWEGLIVWPPERAGGNIVRRQVREAGP
ncbi:MAG TPA: class I SAM-dependent methyltransferase [Dehalococcoidia bacterium]|nr:class I SAM-dependent methyltransferase [Dehalococcoidia bacterium]